MLRHSSLGRYQVGEEERRTIEAVTREQWWTKGGRARCACCTSVQSSCWAELGCSHSLSSSKAECVGRLCYCLLLLASVVSVCVNRKNDNEPHFSFISANYRVSATFARGG